MMPPATTSSTTSSAGDSRALRRCRSLLLGACDRAAEGGLRPLQLPPQLHASLSQPCSRQ